MADMITIDGARFKQTACPTCAMSYLIPAALFEVAWARRPEVSVYCPNGHAWHYTRGESEFDKVRRERDRAWQKLAERDDAIREAQDKAAHWRAKAKAAAKDLAQLDKRAAAGVCPCCSRYFVQMQRHMKTKHPQFVAEAI